MRARVDRRTVQKHQEMAAAANRNEQITRQRVEDLETKVAVIDALVGRDFWGRLRWLVLGR